MDKLTQALVRVSCINQQYVRSLLIVLAYHMVAEERLTTTRRSQDELVAVRGDTFLHRQVTDVYVYGLARQTIAHLDAKGRETVLIVGLA